MLSIKKINCYYSPWIRGGREMKIIYYLERVERIHRLIEQEKTGSPTEFAGRLGISVSRLARIIDELRLQGAPILYDRQRYTYYYKEPYQIEIKIHFGR